MLVLALTLEAKDIRLPGLPQISRDDGSLLGANTVDYEEGKKRAG
jgi:hypothetical protein